MFTSPATTATMSCSEWNRPETVAAALELGSGEEAAVGVSPFSHPPLPLRQTLNQVQQQWFTLEAVANAATVAGISDNSKSSSGNGSGSKPSTAVTGCENGKLPTACPDC